MTSSRRASICRAKSSVSGASGSTWNASRGSKRSRGAGVQPAFPPDLVVAVKRLACELPATLGLPLARFTIPELHRAAVERGLVAQISGTTLWRWLSADAIKPWRVHSWIFPRDPQFAEKAGRVLDLYHRTWDGRPLGPAEYVLSADEKTSIQARRRRHASTPPTPRHPIRVEHEYERCGAYAYFAAWDVHRAKLFGRCDQGTGRAPFDQLVAEVMAREPYRSADRVFWVLDNGSSHQGAAGTARLQGRWPNMVVVHTPVHASWLNQIEIYFSIVQRKVLTPCDFGSLAEVEDRLLRFQTHYETVAQPFEWKFTKSDLAKLLVRLATREAEAAAA